ncbi:MAG: hypothetical protein K0R14_1137 [Burkholderiales bacterium]|jgi:hypothetical protein|nr:hypothetical protein [Burkholderiales bacterium]
MQSIENKIFSIIKGSGRGYIFSGADFTDKFNSATIDWALANLVQEGKIRRLMRGIYDFPKYSPLLKQYLSPEIDKVAHAIARKFKWRIEPYGDLALYLLSLSTQVPGRYIYFSDGPNRKYEIFGNQLEFKKIALKEIGFKYPESALIVQAIKVLGKDNITSEIIKKIRNKINEKLYAKIIKDTKTISDWTYSIIKQICWEAS